MARVIAVASSKGGVGKTTTTANLAATLAAADYDVAVVDGDIGMANLGNQLGVEATGPTLHDVLAGEASVAEATYEGPHGISVVPGDTALTAFSTADVTRLGRVIGSFADRDFVLVDTGAGLSHESAIPLGLADEVLLVSTPDRDALGDTQKTNDLAERLGAAVVGVVLTRVTPGDAVVGVVLTRVTPGDAPDDVSPLTVPVLGAVPEDAALREANDAAVPVTMHDPDSPAAAAYRGVASELADGPVRPPTTEGARVRGGGSESAAAVDENPASDPENSASDAEDPAGDAEAAAREFRESIQQGAGVDAPPDSEAADEPEAATTGDPEPATDPEGTARQDVTIPDPEGSGSRAGDAAGDDEAESGDAVETGDDADADADADDVADATADDVADATADDVADATADDEDDEVTDEDAVPFAESDRTTSLADSTRDEAASPGEGDGEDGDPEAGDEKKEKKKKKGFLNRLFG